MHARREGLRASQRTEDTGPSPATDDVAAKVEQERALAAHVLALEEPYRSAVLLRYYREMSAAQVGLELGIPPATVRTHCKRGLERLRTKLDQEQGGDGRSWILALAPLCSEPLTPSLALPLAGGQAVLKTIAVAGLVSVLGLTLWWSRSESVIPEALDVTAAGAVSKASLLATGTPALVDPAEVVQRASLEQEAAIPQAPPAEPTGLIVRVVRGDDRSPLQGVSGYLVPTDSPGGEHIVWPEADKRPGVLELAESDEDGQMRWDLPEGVEFQLDLSSSEALVGNLKLPIAALGKQELRELQAELPVGPDIHYFGRLVDSATGEPLADQEVHIPNGWSSNGVVENFASTTADSQGYFELHGCSWMRQHLQVDVPGFGRRLAVLVPGHETRDSAQELRLQRSATLDLRVTGKGGEPIDVEVRATTGFSGLIQPRTSAGDTVGHNPHWSQGSGADGRASITGLPPGVPIALELWRAGALVRRVAEAPELTPGETRVLELSLGLGARIWARRSTTRAAQWRS